MRVSVTTLVVAFLLGCSGRYPPSVADREETRQSSDRESVLNRIILDVLTNSDLEEIRLQYSRKGDERFALVNNKAFGCLWPSAFKPSIQGYDYFFLNEGDRQSDDRAFPVLGIRLDKLDLTEAKVDPFKGNVEVCLLNAGGYKGNEDLPIGGTSIYYHAKRTQQGWSVEWLMLQSP